MFTKLDLKSAFLQLELSNDSRSITTFQSDTRLKRFKWLIFGVNFSHEELQYALREVLSGIKGAPHILIYGKCHKKHDEILSQVLKRLEDSGLTLNLEKCLFVKENLRF